MPFLDNSIHFWRVWRGFVRSSLIRDIEFRANFVSGLIRQLLWLGAFLIFIEVIFNNTDSLSGWSQTEVLIVLALSRFIEGLADTTFGRNISNLPESINEGRFDFFLTKPLPAQFYTAFHRFHYSGLGNVATGIIMLIYAGLAGSLPAWPWWIAFVFLVIIGLIIYYSILIIIVSLAFYTEQLNSFRAILHMITEPFTVPFDIFPRGPRIALTYLLPLAFVVFVPAQALTGRLAWTDLPIAAGIAVLFLFLSNFIWRAGLKRYSSASS